MEAIQVDILYSIRKVLVSVPRGNAEGVSRPPGNATIPNSGITLSGHNMVDRRGRFLDAWRPLSNSESLSGPSQDFGDYISEVLVIECPIIYSKEGLKPDIPGRPSFFK